MKNQLNLLPVFACLALFCSVPVSDGNGSHSGNPLTITGKLLTVENKPAVHAVVRFIPVNSILMPGNEKASGAEFDGITDENGDYGFDSLPDTLYNVFGEGDNNLSFRYSVKIVKKDPTRVPDDTLKAPGSIHGIVRLQPEHSSRTVILLLPGTNTYVVPTDSIGHFTIPRMARGRYPISILSTLPNYKTKDTFFTVRSGMSDTLDDTLRLEYAGIPKATGVKAIMDSLRIFVALSWNKIDTSVASGYNIYRGNADSAFGSTPINKTLVKDTFYVDRDLVQRQGQRMVYKVKTVTRNGDEGKEFSSEAGTIISSAFYEKEKMLLPEQPQSIALNKNGDLFVQYAGEFGKIFRFRQDSSNAEEINFGYDIFLDFLTLDSNGNFYGAPGIAPTNTIIKFDSNGVFIKEIGHSTFQVKDVKIVGNDTIYALLENEFVELRVFNTNGDSLANFRVQKCAGTPFSEMITAMAISDSFVMLVSPTTIKSIDRFSGITYKEYTNQQWVCADYSPVAITANHNNFYYLNSLQGRFYQISIEGEVLNTIETYPLTAQSIKTDFPPMAICLNSELIVALNWESSLLKYGRKP